MQDPGICGRKRSSASDFMTNCIPYSCAVSGTTYRAQLKPCTTSVQDRQWMNSATIFLFFQQKIVSRIKLDRIIGVVEVFIFNKYPKQHVTDPHTHKKNHIKKVHLMFITQGKCNSIDKNTAPVTHES